MDMNLDAVKRLTEAIKEAAQKIAEAFMRWAERIRAAICATIRLGKLKRVMIKYEAAKVWWHARGPRRNQALMRAIMMKRRCGAR